MNNFMKAASLSFVCIVTMCMSVHANPSDSRENARNVFRVIVAKFNEQPPDNLCRRVLLRNTFNSVPKKGGSVIGTLMELYSRAQNKNSATNSDSQNEPPIFDENQPVDGIPTEEQKRRQMQRIDKFLKKEAAH